MNVSFEVCEMYEQNQHSAIGMVCRPLLCKFKTLVPIHSLEKKGNDLTSKTCESCLNYLLAIIHTKT